MFAKKRTKKQINVSAKYADGVFLVADACEM